jgi:sporulation protein YlmC with PRC-barrel domain
MSTLLIISLLLAACGAEETSTALPTGDVPPITAEVTMTGEATSETPDVDLTTTPAVPVTGENDPSRLSNLLDFDVWNQNGEQLGEVDDMVLDLDNTNISYVIVGTGGFLDLGEKDILIPWSSLELQTPVTGGQENAFVLLADNDMLENAPDFDVDANLPGVGQPAENWDVDIRNFWEGGVVPEATQVGTGSATPAADTTTVPEMTATTTTGSATATSSTSSAGTGTGQADKLQGVMLASDLLGSTLTIGNQGGEGQGVGQATVMPEATATTDTASTAMPDATATASTGTGAGVGTGTGGPTSATIEDAIVDPDTGEILFLVLNSLFDDGERWIPVPLSTLRWDMTNESFLFVANANALQNAPFFEADQFPDTTAEGWDSEFDTFWQNNGGTGTTEGGAVATATP